MRTTMHAAFIIVTLCVVVGSTSRVAAFVPSPFINNQLHRNRVGPRAAATVDSSEKSADDSSNDATVKVVEFLQHVIPDDAPTHRLEKAFNTSMINPAVPLLSSWKNYGESLPSRGFLDTEKFIRLKDVPFYATEDSIQLLAKQLEDEIKPKPGIPRFGVAYLSAKTRSGKTASIMSAFLNSYESDRKRRFTHYLYVPFKNNGVNNYGTSNDANKSKPIAEQQGALFIYKCVASLLKGRYTGFEIESKARIRQIARERALPFSDDAEEGAVPKLVQDTTSRINELFNKKIPGKHQRILVHLDEHREMNDNPHFRRGAMIALAMCPRVKCVATFTEPLTELLSIDESSGVSRQPCTLVTFDLRAYLDKRYFIDIRRLVAWPDLELTSIQKRKWATLAFRMAAKVQSSLPSTLALADANDKSVKLDKWMRRVQNALKSFDKDTDGMTTLDENNGGIALLNNALGQCSRAANLDATVALKQNQFALDLMNGILEDELADHFGNNRVGCGLTVFKGMIVASWQDLLTLEYKNVLAFGDASQSFRDSLTEPDYLSGTPLEEAYGWSLLSRSAARGRLRFGVGFSFDFKADKYTTGRLFRTDTTEHLDQMVNPMKLKNGVLYRAAEGGNGVDFLKNLPTVNDVQADQAGDQGVTAPQTAAAAPRTKKNKPRITHPLCDFFFKSDDDELVMIDITGGNDLTEEKAKKLDEWIDENEDRLTTGTGLFGIAGIVLAPFDKAAAATETSGEASAIQPGIELPAGDSSDEEEEEKKDVSAIEEGDGEQPSANEGGAEESVEEAQGDRNDGAGSATIYGKGGREQVLMVTGSNAVGMLGALGQFAKWFDADNLGEPIIPAAEPPAGTDEEEGQAAQPDDESSASSEAGLE